MTDMEFLKNMKKGEKIIINDQVLKAEKIENFEDDLGDDWRLIYFENGYKLKINEGKINFFHVTELGEGDEFLEIIRINKIEEAMKET